MSNKALGTAFEEELAEILHRHGYWVHLLRQTETGQPADMIAVRNQRAFLIDAKVCSNDSFPLSRVEENQELAMRAWATAGNDSPWFALKTTDGIFMIPYSYFFRVKQWGGTKGLNRNGIKRWGFALEEWLKEWGDVGES